MTPSNLLSALNWRYATKQFDATRKIPGDAWEVLERALVLAPSSFGVQPWQFLVIDDPEVRTQLSAASWGQTQPVDASHYVVFTIRKNLDDVHIQRYIEDAAATRGIPVESLDGYKNVVVGFVERLREAGTLDAWAARQVYIALGQFMTSAAVLAIDTCPMEGIDPAKYDEILGLTGTDYATVCGCAAGYRSASDKYATTPKVRFPGDMVVKHI
ncbi:MAG: NAD(P)H-dependent oxidoreductase [Opitutaceae bacterium]